MPKTEIQDKPAKGSANQALGHGLSEHLRLCYFSTTFPRLLPQIAFIQYCAVRLALARAVGRKAILKS